jgi:pyruvate kinase
MEEILSLCDGVMVARGDLGVELPAEDVPILQKRLINTANQLGIPIITATQMLDSTASNPSSHPRRGFGRGLTPILDGTDAVMLSNETAVGHYPIEAVATIAALPKGLNGNRSIVPLALTINNRFLTLFPRQSVKLPNNWGTGNYYPDKNRLYRP